MTLSSPLSLRHSPTLLRKLSLLLLGMFNPRNLLSFQFLVVNAVMKLDLLTVDDVMLLSKNPTLSYNAARYHRRRSKSGDNDHAGSTLCGISFGSPRSTSCMS